MKLTRTLMTLLAAAAFTAAQAAQKYNITLFQDSELNGTELKSGTYKLIVEDDSKVVLAHGSKKVEATAKKQTAEKKFNTTSVRYQNGDGKYRIAEIRLGGTNTILTFNN